MHRRRKFHGRQLTCAGAIALVLSVSIGSSSSAGATEAKVETLLSELKSPSAVAIRPDSPRETYEVYVAESGAGRVVQAGSAAPGPSVEAVVGLPLRKSELVDNASGRPGIQSLFFLDRSRVVVAGGDEQGVPYVRMYDLSESDTALKADEFKQDVELTGDSKKSTQKIHCFTSAARTQPNDKVADMLVLTATDERGDPAGIWKIPVRANTLGDVARPDKANPGNELGATGGIAVGGEGHIVVACDRDGDTTDSACLKYLSPIDGHVVLHVPIELEKVSALAYNRKSGNLYATGSAAKEQGVYRIDDASDRGKQASTVVQIAKVDQPTAMAIGPDGTIYVTTAGDEKHQGTLLKITGEK